MSKSKGNVTAPAGRDQGIRRRHPAALGGGVRLFGRLRIGPEILKTFVETYRKLRNTLRYMLGALAHHEPASASRSTRCRSWSG